MPYEFECFQSGCSFMLRADSEDEIVRLVQKHADEEHGLDIDTGAIESEIETV
jgi:predicted small metal-binding protein